MCNVHGHVVKMLLGASTKRYVAPLAYITSTYQERLICRVTKHKHLRLCSKAIFYFYKVCSCKILMCACHQVLPPRPRHSLP